MVTPRTGNQCGLAKNAGEPKIGCLPTPCTTCPYRRDVASGIWSREEYEKLPAYDRETWGQPPALFMCHQNDGGLCTGWLQSHANRPHAFDLLALRMNLGKLDTAEVSRVALLKPAVALFRTGRAAMRHGLKQLLKPGKRAVDAIDRIIRKRQRVT